MYVIDERNGEICRYIRSRSNKQQAIDLATKLYAIQHDEVIRILQQEGLMDEQGNYIEPIRLTGKEHMMDRKKPDYYWSSKRKQQLREMYENGQAASAIADQLGTTTNIIYEAIAKFDITRDRKADAAPLVEQEPPTEPAPPVNPPSVRMQVESARHNSESEPWINASNLRELSRLVNYSRTLAQDAPSLFLKDQCYEAFMALGRLDVVLQDAQSILRKVFPRPSHPPTKPDIPEP